MGTGHYTSEPTELEPIYDSRLLSNDSATQETGRIRKNAGSGSQSSAGRLEGPWSKYGVFASLAISTVTSSLLLASSVGHWTESGRFYHTVVSNRASTQFAIQLLSYLLGLIQVTSICRIINYSTRLRMKHTPVSLDVLHLWNSLSAARMDWSVRMRFVWPLLLFVAFTSVPSALWAGAITPVSTLASRSAIVNVPSYENVSLITEYPSEINSLGPILRTPKGMFSYSVGMKYLGSLLSSAATATPLNGGVRLHPKYDNSRFIYVGRSYGVGSSPGLTDDSILNNNFAVSYSYLEPGYEPVVECIYNRSSEFTLSGTSEQEGNMLYVAGGNLPDSTESPEYSVYVGHGPSAIVAIGVAHSLSSARRYLAIAAGSSYAMLNATQCTIDFHPAVFNISVSLPGRNITVARLVSAGATTVVPDMDPTRNLTKTAIRQLELIANDQTNLYVSLVGDSLNSSIADSISSANFPTETAILTGLTNSITAMIDDILTSYASAQLMIANATIPTVTTLNFTALRFGQDVYIYAVAIVNGLVIVCVVIEAVRMRGWRGLLRFNYLDPRDLIVAAAEGGRGDNVGGKGGNGWNGGRDKADRIRLITNTDRTHLALVLDSSPTTTTTKGKRLVSTESTDTLLWRENGI